MPTSKKDYRSLRDELDALLEALQLPDVDLDEALRLYKRGQKLVTELETYLKTAENQIHKLAGTEAPEEP